MERCWNRSAAMLKQPTLSALMVTLLLSESAALMFTLPHKLAAVFLAEERVIHILQTQLYPSYRVAQYLDATDARIAQVPIGNSSHDIPVRFLKQGQTILRRHAEAVQEKLVDNDNAEQHQADAVQEKLVGNDILEHHADDVLEKLVGNPLHVLSLVVRVTQMLPSLTEEIEELGKIVSYQGNSKMEGFFLMDKTKIELPNLADLEGVSSNIVRIQFVFRYDPVALSQGIIGGHLTEGRLTSTDVMFIAGFCYKNKFFASAIEWAEAAKKLSSQQSIDNFVKEVAAEHDARWAPPDGATTPNKQFFVEKFGGGAATGRQLRMREGDYLTGTDHRFHKLCRGEGSGGGGVRGEGTGGGGVRGEVSGGGDGRGEGNGGSGARGEVSGGGDVRGEGTGVGGGWCRLSTMGVPYLTLAPVKLEEVSNSPTLHVFHQVLTQKQIDILKSTAYREGFNTAQTGYTYREDPPTDRRVQATVWLEDDHDPDLHKLSRKSGDITGLECARNKDQLERPSFHKYDPAEAFQVGVYPPGGHYIRHHDSHNKRDPIFLFDPALKDTIWYGNRLATLMYYLSNVVGGRTVFPQLGVSITPEVGSAVFWFNLDSRGAKDGRMYHGACPTALGVKWVSNKWISEGAQIWRRPCTNLTHL